MPSPLEPGSIEFYSGGRSEEDLRGYPAHAAQAVAQLSIAISLKRIADVFERDAGRLTTLAEEAAGLITSEEAQALLKKLRGEGP